MRASSSGVWLTEGLGAQPHRCGYSGVAWRGTAQRGKSPQQRESCTVRRAYKGPSQDGCHRRYGKMPQGMPPAAYNGQRVKYRIATKELDPCNTFNRCNERARDKNVDATLHACWHAPTMRTAASRTSDLADGELPRLSSASTCSRCTTDERRW